MLRLCSALGDTARSGWRLCEEHNPGSASSVIAYGRYSGEVRATKEVGGSNTGGKYSEADTLGREAGMALSRGSDSKDAVDHLPLTAANVSTTVAHDLQRDRSDC